MPPFFEEDWNIESGPRNKWLATYHLQYIVTALLDKNTVANFIQSNSGVIVKVNNQDFNLSKILAARPDFDQLTFDETQLSAYLHTQEKLKNIFGFAYKPKVKNWSELHYAEHLAIRRWTGQDYYIFNRILRSCSLPIRHENLTTICIASQGLSKPLDSPSNITQCNRLESGIANVQRQRTLAATQKRIISNHGFTAATTASRWKYGYGEVEIDISLTQTLNPQGKSLKQLSLHPEENEVLFPPNTDFQYAYRDYKWHAKPVRSANAAEEKEYEHNLTDEQLKQIEANNILHRLNILNQYLKNELNPQIFQRIFESALNRRKNINSIFIEINYQYVICKNQTTKEILKTALSAIKDIKELSGKLERDPSSPSVPQQNHFFTPQSIALINKAYFELYEEISNYVSYLNKCKQTDNSSELKIKHAAAKQLLNCFQNISTASTQEKLDQVTQYKEVLSDIENKALLSKHRTSQWKRMVYNFLNLVSILGATYQIYNTKSLCFWRSKGELMIQRMNQRVISLEKTLS